METPTLPLEKVVRALADINRWRILSELSTGETLMVIEIAERIRRTPVATSRHMTPLREAGLVVTNRAGLYSIPKQYLPTPGQRLIDYGHCLLRLDPAKISA